MTNILIANTKGGSGKTTLATNLAGYFASLGSSVVLTDLDRQQSSAQWLERRPAELPLIQFNHTRSKPSKLEPDWVVTDSPAGLRDDKLAEAVKQATCVLVPIQPSAFDIGATSDFLDILAAEKAIRKSKTFVALVGMRVNMRTHSAAKLAEFMEQSGFPVLTSLRSAQVYTHVAEQGLSIFDMRSAQVTQDLQQWVPLLDWVMQTTDAVD
jgi:chromosome partitioning protein